MIIDDDDDIRMALVMIMTAHGYEIAAHGNARAALTALRDGCQPFLILLDLMMAGMTGWEFRAVQMGDPTLATFPVVILTAVSSARDGSPGLDGVEIMEKPFELDALLTVVRRYAAAAHANEQPAGDPAAEVTRVAGPAADRQ
jgi:two-component system C4-dicarboxylate transport response regulator DctD